MTGGRRSRSNVRPSISLYGAGMISGAHAAAANVAGMPIVGVASRTRRRAEEQAQRLNTVALTYADLPAGADIVVVSTPPHCHAADTLAMLRAGAAVIVEKPLCTTLADADLLVAEAERWCQRVLYAENLAYSPMVATLLAVMPALGAVRHLAVRCIQPLPTWGDFTSDEWGGGALFDLGVHPLAIAVLVAGAAGAGPVASVSATLDGGVGHDSDEHAEVSLTFASGLVGQIVSSWRGHEGGQIWDVEASSDHAVLRGDFWPQPSLEHNGETIRLERGNEAAPMIEELGYATQLRSFCEDLRRGSTPLMDIAFGRLILDIVCAAYRSAGRASREERVPFSGDRTKTPLQLWRDGAAM